MNCKYGFKEARKGYDPQEVDAYIDEQLATMAAMQKQNEVLMRKLREAEAKLSTISQKEQSLKNSIAESKRGAAAMLSDARNRSNNLIDSARHECNKIVDELDAEIESRYKTIEDMRGAVTSFKNELFRLYSDHIENIEALANAAEEFSYEPDFTALSEAIDQFEEKGDVVDVAVPEFPEETEDAAEEIIPEDLDTLDAVEEEIEEPKLSQLEFGFDEPEEAEDGEAVTVSDEEEEAETEEELFYDPAETAEAEETEDELFAFEAEEDVIPVEETEAEADEEEAFAFPETEETAEKDVFDFVTEEDIFAFLDDIENEAAQEIMAEENGDDDIFAFPEENSEVSDPDDDMFITDKDEHKDKEELFNFLKDFVNGTEE